MTWYEGNNVNNVMVYTRHEVPEVMWQASKAANVIKSGLQEADRANIWVPYKLHDGTDRRDTLNFKVGDYLVRGIVNDEITATFTIAKLLKKYPSAVKVTSVDDKDYSMSGENYVRLGGG
jgi:hypothetical protein